jgi:catecholate siderophore receptor
MAAGQQVIRRTAEDETTEAATFAETRDGAQPAGRSARHATLVGTAVSLASLMAAGAAGAQETGVALPTIDVTGDQGSPDNSLQADTGVSRLGRVQDIPQTVNVINQQTLQQQNVTTLDQALTNVPGVTVAIGEGGGGMNGDQFRIRGFQAKGDIYTDGLRDFGVYVRDSFAYDEIQVIKGPSSENFGMGTTGGAINNVLKQARPVDFLDVQGTAGNGPMARAVVDVNRKISDTSAIRIVGMGHKQELVDRDYVFSDRAGLFAAAAFGIGTPTTFHVNYLYQHGERQPDMGEPIVTPAGAANGSGAGKPASSWGTPRQNYFGKETDADRHNVHMLTARLKSEVTDWLTVTNDSRLAFYNRYWAQTVVSCSANNQPACVAGVTNGNFNVAYGFGGPAGFVQDTWGLQNITTAIAKFQAAGLRHELIAGIDVFHQGDKRTQLANSVTNANKNAGTMEEPIFQSNYTVGEDQGSLKDGSSTGFGAFVSDRIWLVPQFSVLGGLRWDNFHSTYQTTTNGVWNPELIANDSFFSPKVSGIWEPTKAQTYYVTWSRSYSALAGQFISNDNNAISATSSIEPEKNDLWEAGAKLNFLDGRLGATAALFQVKKGNAMQVDPTTGDIVPTGETQRVRGVELGLTGRITDAWTVQVAYAYMQSKILTATPANAANIGNEVSFVPKHSASLWTTYDIAPLFTLPGKLLVGGGFVYTDDYFVNSQNTAIIPSSFVVNAMISYEYKNYRVALNGYNLTNELYYASGFGSRAVVAAGPTVMLTGGIRW